MHRLCANAVIQDFEKGVLNTDPVKQAMAKKAAKKDVIALSKSYSIVTPYTSFVAIEERVKVRGMKTLKGRGGWGNGRFDQDIWL